MRYTWETTYADKIEKHNLKYKLLKGDHDVLCFENVNINYKRAKLIAKILPHIPQLHTLRFEKTPFVDEENMEILMEAIRTKPSITHLDISFNYQTDKVWDVFFKELEVNEYITSLTLEGNDMAHKIKAIVTMIEKNKSITSLNLKYNFIDDQNIAILAEALKENTSFTSLDLRHNDLSSKGINAISNALKYNKNLRSCTILPTYENFHYGSFKLLVYDFIRYIATSFLEVADMFLMISQRRPLLSETYKKEYADGCIYIETEINKILYETPKHYKEKGKITEKQEQDFIEALSKKDGSGNILQKITALYILLRGKKEDMSSLITLHILNKAITLFPGEDREKNILLRDMEELLVKIILNKARNEVEFKGWRKESIKERCYKLCRFMGKAVVSVCEAFLYTGRHYGQIFSHADNVEETIVHHEKNEERIQEKQTISHVARLEEKEKNVTHVQGQGI